MLWGNATGSRDSPAWSRRAAPAILALALKLMIGVLAIYAFLAVGDAVYQRISWMKRQRMTKRELKEEYKETEGNPEIKAKLRQIRARPGKRMMAAVPNATVIITNPTHYAVALKYERGMAAPVCVAKGVDAIALRFARWRRSTGCGSSRTRRWPVLCMRRWKSTKKFRWSTIRPSRK